MCYSDFNDASLEIFEQELLPVWFFAKDLCFELIYFKYTVYLTWINDGKCKDFVKFYIKRLVEWFRDTLKFSERLEMLLEAQKLENMIH